MLDEYPSKTHPKLKSRARKGIPDSGWGDIWYKLSQAEIIDSDYAELCDEEVPEKDLHSIVKDITRTFPKHIYFFERYGKGQMALLNVLKSISLSNSDTGYVQGMGYIAAVLLMYQEEERAYSTLNALLVNYNLREFFLPGMPKL